MIDWLQIDTVLLDMDGTLLDLHFDNYFWLTHLPERYAQIHKLDFNSAKKTLETQINAKQGSLEWYCLEYWSNTLNVDILQLKTEIKHKIQTRPHTEDFLKRLRGAGKRVVLITNAHRQSVDLKFHVTSLDSLLDIVISSHDYRHPKEKQAFWHALQLSEPFDPKRTLFIDDSLAVLQAAEIYGIHHILGIHQPDSTQTRVIKEYPAIHGFNEIMPHLSPEN